MIRISVVPEDEYLAQVVSSLEMVSSKVMPNTFKAFKMAANLLSYTWKSYALGAPIPGNAHLIKRPTGVYAKSIKIRMLSPFNYYIYSDSPYASYIEDGIQTYDMKEKHPYGQRSRVSADGVPYLIIPFRHGVPGTKSYPQLPEQIYTAIRAAIKNDEVQMSKVVKGKKIEPNYRGELIPRSNYKWGSRIKGTGVANLEGMVAFDVSTPKSARTEYVTFRIISANSPAHKWIHPGTPGKKIAQSVSENTKDIVKEILSDGLKKDLGVI